MKFEFIRDKICNEFGRDPFSKSESWNLIKKRIPENHWSFLVDRSGADGFRNYLPSIFPADRFYSDEEAQTCWERIGNFYKNQFRWHEAISIYLSLYYQLLDAQNFEQKRIRKGTPLVWISDCYASMGFPVLSKRHLMLALCENAIHEKGIVPPDTTGTYWRLVFRHGLPHSEVQRYGARAYELSNQNQPAAFFPEWVVQELDNNWMTEIPSPAEAGVWVVNVQYVKMLMSKFGDKKGENLEKLSEYLMSCMPGCRTYRRLKTESTDYDVICSMEGFEVDFRSDFGRYFVCECKDWSKPADFTTIAKFCRVLDSVKSKFGILFSKRGISGHGKSKYAERELIKVFQDRGMVIIVLNEEDLNTVANGMNFVNMLRIKYETIRLDLKSYREGKSDC